MALGFNYLKTLFQKPCNFSYFQNKQPKYLHTTIHFGTRAESHQSGIKPDYTRPGGEYVNLKKRKFFSRFFETKLNNATAQFDTVVNEDGLLILRRPEER